MEQPRPQTDREPTELDLWTDELRGIVVAQFAGVEDPKFRYEVPNGGRTIDYDDIESAVASGAAHTLGIRSMGDHYPQFIQAIYRGMYDAHPDNLG